MMPDYSAGLPISPKIGVLVVEDEVLIRMGFVLQLEEAGYRVKEASSAAEAIEILEGDRTIRVVFTDIQMPGDMDGVALAKCIRERWPPTVIVITSANVASVEGRLDADIHLLDKPVAAENLRKIVDAVAAEIARGSSV